MRVGETTIMEAIKDLSVGQPPLMDRMFRYRVPANEIIGAKSRWGVCVMLIHHGFVHTGYEYVKCVRLYAVNVPKVKHVIV
jgi:hypothetical protein